jgi:hypothetical protein
MASAPLAGHLLDRFRPGLLLAADNAARGLLTVEFTRATG